MNKRIKALYFWMIIFVLTGTNFLPAQISFKQFNGSNGGYDFVSTYSDSYLHFSILGDGYYSFESNFNHQYHLNNIPANAYLYRVGPYEDEDPDSLNHGNSNQGLINPNIPHYTFENKIEVKKSWNLVPNKKNYYILQFENNNNEVLSGCVEFHIDTTQIAVDEGGILDQYNSWVFNRTLQSSEFSNEGYDVKYVWQFSDLKIGEQRIIYIPAQCLISKMDKAALRGVIKYNCSSIITYDASNDGNLKNVNNSNYFTLNEIVRGYPHDPNCIVTDPYALSTFDEDQTVLYTIFFHNEGNAPAHDVRLDFKIDKPVHSISYVASSDPCSIVPNNNAVIQEAEINFLAVDLPGLAQIHSPNYYSTIGWVSLEICLDPTTWPQDFASSYVDIYFDSLPAIRADHTIYRLINHSLNSNCFDDPNLIREEASTNLADLTDIKIFPNPTRDISIIELPENMAGETRAYLYDLSGKLLWNDILNSTREKINLSAFNNGVYTLVLSDNLGNKETRFILKY